MAARLAPVLMKLSSTNKVLHGPSTTSILIELSETSPRTPFSAVAPPRRHDQLPIFSRIQTPKILETIFEEDTTTTITTTYC